MTQLVLLGLQIATILLIGWDLNGYPFNDAQTIALQTNHFLGIVGQKSNLPDAQVNQDLGADAVMPQVGPET